MSDIKLLLQRYSDNGNDTLGLFLNVTEKPSLLAYTLEDEYRQIKLRGETRIKAGTYPVRLRKHLTPLTMKYRHRFPWFTWHLEICNVPGFDGVYIHIGNSENDTDGCVLVGHLTINNKVAKGRIGDSTNAFQRLYEWLYNELEYGRTVTITIKDEDALCA